MIIVSSLPFPSHFSLPPSLPLSSLPSFLSPSLPFFLLSLSFTHVVCVHVCGCVHASGAEVCARVYAEARGGHGIPSSILLYLFLSLKIGLVLKLELAIFSFARLMARVPSDPPVSTWFQCWGDRCMCVSSPSSLCAGNLNAGPHSHTASALNHQPISPDPFSPLIFFFIKEPQG